MSSNPPKSTWKSATPTVGSQAPDSSAPDSPAPSNSDSSSVTPSAPGLSKKLADAAAFVGDNVKNQFKENLGSAADADGDESKEKNKKSSAGADGDQSNKKKNKRDEPSMAQSMMELVDNLQKMLADINNRVNEFLGINSLKDKISNKLDDAGSAIKSGIMSGIGNAASAIADKIRGSGSDSDAPLQTSSSPTTDSIPPSSGTGSSSSTAPGSGSGSSSPTTASQSSGNTSSPAPQVNALASPNLEPMSSTITKPSDGLANTNINNEPPSTPTPSTAPDPSLDKTQGPSLGS
jgi:hypothetical protein